MRFLTEADYNAQIRSEILAMIDGGETEHRIHKAEDMAIAQMKGYLSARYDVDVIFKPQKDGDKKNEGNQSERKEKVDPDLDPDPRNPYIVMLVVDLTLYHIWSKERASVPQVRNDRYQDALDWLKGVGNGEKLSDLPYKKDSEQNGTIHIRSSYPPNNHKY